MGTHILRIDCTDRLGLIHGVTAVLLSNNVNIVENDEYVDRSTGRFYMRTEFSGDFDSGKVYDEVSGALPENAVVHLTGKRKKNIVVMASMEHHCIGDILVRHMFDDLGANILAVISNHTVLKELTERMKLPFHFVSHDNLTREAHEKKVMTILNEYQPEYIILAKYMRILTPEFTQRYNGRIINIHHSFLPAFIGANPYRQAFTRGVKIIGATAHFVNQELDEGPIIAQDVIHVNHSYSAEDMAKAGRDVEKTVLARAMNLVFEERVIISGNKTVIYE